MACGNITYGSDAEHRLSELRILLVGNVKSGKSSAANIILGHDSFVTKRTGQCLKGQGEVAGRKITVVEAPGWWSDRLVEDSTNLLKQEIVLSALQCPPGPHAVLLVVRLKLNFTDIDRQILEGHLSLFGDQVWSHTIVLFTSNDWLGNITAEQYMNYEGRAIKWLVEKCSDRYHVLMSKNRDGMQVAELLEKIEKMVKRNRGRHFDTDTKIFRELEERRRAEEERSMERRMKVSKQREDVRKCGVHVLSELRIVLLGCRNSGKSSSGNTILGKAVFDLNRAVMCVMREQTVAKRKITVVEAPGWWRDRPVDESTELLKQEIVHSVSVFGQHAVLLVVNGGRRFTDKDRIILAGYMKLLGDKIWSHTIVLFTFGDSLGDTAIERHIESEGEALRWLVEKCGNIYHVFNNKKTGDEAQVIELLEKIEEMMAENRGSVLDVKDKEVDNLALGSITYGSESEHHLSELRIWLVESAMSEKSSAQCLKGQREVAGRKITVVKAPGWWRDRRVDESTELLKQEIVHSVSVFAPHAVLLVVNGGRRFTDKDRIILAGYMKLLGDKIWSHTIVLFTFGDSLGDTTIERHIEGKGKALRWLVEKCGNRYHVFNNKKTGDEAQVIELLEKIEEMMAGNKGLHCTKVETMMTTKPKRKKKERKAPPKDSAGAMPHLSEVRLVLLGCRAAGKSSARNTILGREEFNSEGVAECVKKQGRVAGREITVVEAPGWQSDKAIKQLLKQEVVLSVSMCPPGPHAFLLVLRLDLESRQSGADSFKGYMKLLTKNAWSHSLVLFTFGDGMKDLTIEQYIEGKGKALRWLIEKCGQRYHVFDNQNQGDGAQVTELLQKIEEMVAGNSSSYLELNPAVIEKVKERKKAEKKRSNERMSKVSRRRTYFHEILRLSEVRIVLLGCRNAGKSSSASTILGDAKTTFNQSDKCMKRQGEVAGRTVTVVEFPGWLRNHDKRTSSESLQQEIKLSLSMCPPGLHAVLLVVCLDFAFRNKHRKALVQYLNLLGYEFWSHTIVLFTCGDSLGDTTIERYIESEGAALRWLVEKCGNRYHVFNNQNRHDRAQVKGLLEKIEEMVAENRGHGLDPPLPTVTEWKRPEVLILKGLSLWKDIESDSGIEQQGPLFHNQSPEITPPSFSKSLSSWHSKREFQKFKEEEEVIFQSAYSSRFLRSSRIPRKNAKKQHLADAGPASSRLVPNRSEDNEYRILLARASMFICRFTNLGFEMERTGEVVYRILNWDSHVLDGLGKKELAGPLYSIECLEGSIRYLHLPHCETCLLPGVTGKKQVELTVAHMTGGNVEILQPLRVTDTHVIIDIQGLSFFGILRAWLFQVNPITAQVLLFYNKERSTLNIHLLPGNVSVEEVQRRHESNTYIPTSSKCQLTPGKTYRPSCKTTDCDYVSQPEDEQFDSDYGPNYHPTFELLFNTEVPNVTLSLLDEKGQLVWKPRMVLLKGTERAKPQINATDFVDQHRERLIQNVPSVMEIADRLISKNMISTENYNEIHEKRTSQGQMRLLYKYLGSGGSKVKAEFYQILREKFPFLVEA